MKLVYSAALMLLTAQSYAQPGSVDSSFGDHGKVFVSFNQTGLSYGLHIQPDDKILVSGVANGRFTIGRFLKDGIVDAGFANNGFDDSPFPIQSRANCIVGLADGRVMTGGYVDTGANTFALARYTTTGTLDNSFNGTGALATQFSRFGGGECFAIAIQNDGKIVTAGNSGSYYTLGRFWPDGRADSSFADSGKIFDNSSSSLSGISIYSVAIQSDGKIVIMGNAITSLSNTSDFIACRFKPNGQKDSTFGTNGDAIVDFGGIFDKGMGGCLMPDGSMLVGGYTWKTGTVQDFAIMKLKANGTLDSSFGTNGTVITDIGADDIGRCIAIQPDNRILLAGGSQDHIAVVRYLPDGVIDKGFGDNGVEKLSFALAFDKVVQIGLQSDGKIILSGWSQHSSSGDYSWLITRLNGGWGTGIDEIVKTQTDLKVYPNPANETFRLKIEPSEKINMVEIFSTTGKLLKAVKGTDVKQISVDDFAPGNYVVRVMLKGGRIVTSSLTIDK